MDREFVSGEGLFGKVGTCTNAHYEDQEISIMDSALSILRVPITAVSEMTKSIPKPRPLMTFEHITRPTKLQMLGRLGMTSAQSAPPVELNTNKALVEGITIQMWSVLLEHTFSQASFYTWSPDSMYVYFQRLKDQDEEGRGLLADAFRRSISRYEKVFFPLQCPEGTASHESGHWTLLVVQAMEDGVRLEEPRVRYYETMNDANEVCQERGLLILQVLFPTLGTSALATALTRCQVFRQVGTDCG